MRTPTAFLLAAVIAAALARKAADTFEARKAPAAKASARTSIER